MTLHLSGVSFGQLTDTTCVKTRWLALKPTKINEDIFLLGSNYNDSLDLVFTIKNLVDNKNLKIYNQNEGPYGINGWYYIDYAKEIETNLKESLKKSNKDNYFEISFPSILPIANMYGEDSVITFADGTVQLVYPAPKVYVFPSKECDEIRIKEERTYNKSTMKYEFKPVGLSFYFKGDKYSRGTEKFWVDLNELFSLLDDKNKYPWYNSIKNQKYSGFQYMQVSCYDDEIKK